VLERIENFKLDLCLVPSVHFKVLGGDTDFGCEKVDGFGNLSFGNLDIRRDVLLADELERFDETLLTFLEETFSGEDSVFHQHRDGHRSDSSGNRGDVRSGLNSRIEIDISD
jgi:hypothetical protein